MPLLINDANIFIDLDVAGLTERLFRLPYEFATADVLFEEELRSQHENLLDMGLQLLELAGERMARVLELRSRYPDNSTYDCIALALAEQENCPLLTGDWHLREAGKAEKVEVHGTVWLIEAMVRHRVISLDDAYDAYNHLEAAERRLPFKEARKRLAQHFG